MYSKPIQCARGDVVAKDLPTQVFQLRSLCVARRLGKLHPARWHNCCDFQRLFLKIKTKFWSYDNFVLIPLLSRKL